MSVLILKIHDLLIFFEDVSNNVIIKYAVTFRRMTADSQLYECTLQFMLHTQECKLLYLSTL